MRNNQRPIVKKSGRKVVNMVSAEGFLFADAMIQKKIGG